MRLAVVGATSGASTTFVQDGTTTHERDAPARGDCPDGGAPQDDGGSQGSSPTPS